MESALESSVSRSGRMMMSDFVVSSLLDSRFMDLHLPFGKITRVIDYKAESELYAGPCSGMQ